MIEVTGLRVRGRAAPRLDAVDARFAPGAITLVVGPNGAGKSTLIRCLAGLQAADAGHVRLDGADLAALGPLDRAARVAWLPQHPRPEEGLRAVELVAAARYRFAEPTAAARRAAMAALEALGVAAVADVAMTALSGGEAQRVRLASLWAQEARWWLLDEPANHLDPALRLDMLEVARARAREGHGVVLVTHDLASLGDVGDAAVLALDSGRVAFAGPVDDPRLPDALGRLFGVTVRVVVVDDRPRWLVLGRST